MMQVLIQPSTIKGSITAPASKSVMQRACAAALIRGGETLIRNPGVSADDEAALSIIAQLGAKVKYQDGEVLIQSEGIHPVQDLVHCGESGLSARMFTSIAAVSEKRMTITGTGSLMNRPFDFFDEIFPSLGVRVASAKGKLPLMVQGPLRPADISINGSLSSQFLTGLLFAYAAADAKHKTITVSDLNSKPYVDLTLRVMADFGLKTPLNSGHHSFNFPEQSNPVLTGQQIQYRIEGDWSGAAFLLVAGAIAGEVQVQGIDAFSSQADRAILQPLMQSEAFMSIEAEQVSCRKNMLRPFHFNAKDCPDLFPPLVALASCCRGISVIEGVSRLTHKESNRALTLQQEFEKMGLQIDLQDDMMVIRAEKKLKGAKVNSRNDHRIAMALAIAALSADGETFIEGAEAVNKSYPAFWQHLKELNATVSLNQQP